MATRTFILLLSVALAAAVVVNGAEEVDPFDEHRILQAKRALKEINSATQQQAEEDKTEPYNENRVLLEWCKIGVDDAEQCGVPYYNEEGHRLVPTCNNGICEQVLSGAHRELVNQQQGQSSERHLSEEEQAYNKARKLSNQYHRSVIEWCKVGVDDSQKCGNPYYEEGVRYVPTCVNGQCNHLHSGTHRELLEWCRVGVDDAEKCGIPYYEADGDGVEHRYVPTCLNGICEHVKSGSA